MTIVYPGLFALDAALRLVREVLPALRGREIAARVVIA